eukprot:EW704579.1.p4 GENE.EW704579.1~~EW704579.1.p4  ORF type:complete len:60 (+),score=3.82 EW704579.1:182-361(+)
MAVRAFVRVPIDIPSPSARAVQIKCSPALAPSEKRFHHPPPCSVSRATKCATIYLSLDS